MTKWKNCVWLFGVNLFISTFTFGGGYVVVPMVRKFFVHKKQKFCEEELMEIAAIAQSSPGAIAVNLSVLAGWKVAGWVGAVISGIASVVPALVILSIVSLCYQEFRENREVAAILKGMEAGVAALIVDLVCDMCTAIFREKNKLAILLVPVAFVASFLLQINVAIILLCCCAVCWIQWRHQRRKNKK